MTVQCSNCGKVNAEDIKVINVEEDIFGYDLVTFECPKCKTVQKSNARG